MTEVTLIALKREQKAAKCITHTAKTVARILRRRFERKMEDVLGEDQFGFRKGKELGMQC